MPTPRRQKAPATTQNGQLVELLRFIDLTRGFDFTGYKRSTLERRIVIEATFSARHRRHSSHFASSITIVLFRTSRMSSVAYGTNLSTSRRMTIALTSCASPRLR